MRALEYSKICCHAVHEPPCGRVCRDGSASYGAGWGHSTAIPSGPPSLSETASGPYEIRAPNSSTPLKFRGI